VTLALTADVDTRCLATLNAVQTYGDRMRKPVEAMFYRLHTQGSRHRLAGLRVAAERLVVVACAVAGRNALADSLRVVPSRRRRPRGRRRRRNRCLT
jgi:ABC-type hemin transport system substrate-binding protein